MVVPSLTSAGVFVGIAHPPATEKVSSSLDARTDCDGGCDPLTPWCVAATWDTRHRMCLPSCNLWLES